MNCCVLKFGGVCMIDRHSTDDWPRMVESHLIGRQADSAIAKGIFDPPRFVRKMV